MNKYTTAQKFSISMSILGFLAGSATQLTDILAPFGSLAPVIVKEIVSISGFGTGILGVISAVYTGQNQQIKDVVELAKDPNSPVQGIVTTNSPEGKALAQSIPGPIVTAGGQGAIELAKS